MRSVARRTALLTAASATAKVCAGTASAAALEAIKQGKAYYGDVPILGVPYTTGYEPIRDSSGNMLGVYYVGYKK